MFLPVITKNLNWEMLTNNLITFKFKGGGRGGGGEGGRGADRQAGRQAGMEGGRELAK